MKTNPKVILFAATVLASGIGASAHAGFFSDNSMEMLVVSQTFNHGQSPSDGPTSYVAYDGGYIEAGDAIGGETPPPADVVRQSLYSALDRDGFRMTPVAPSAVLTYHWGVIRVDHREIRLPYSLRHNLVARIELVGTDQLSAEAENHLLGRKKGELNPAAGSEPLLVGPSETVLERAKQPHYFVIVSAYDYQSLLHNDARLLWRTKLSTQDKSGSMEQVIPALLAGGAPYFGKNFDDVKSVTVPLNVPVPQASNASVSNPSPDASQLDKRAVEKILKREHDKFSGNDDHS